jgi:hypothetical protein
VLAVKKYKAVQLFPMYEDRDQDDCNLCSSFILKIEIVVKFLS